MKLMNRAAGSGPWNALNIRVELECTTILPYNILLFVETIGTLRVLTIRDELIYLVLGRPVISLQH